MTPRLLMRLLVAGSVTASCGGSDGPAGAPSPPDPGASASSTSARPASSLDEELIAAAWDNDVDRARKLIAQGADVNARDETQQNAFHIATSEGFGELLELTLANGADPSILDSYNGTGLIRAAHHGHVEVIERLLATDIDVNHVNRLGWTALLEAVILGDGSDRYATTVTLLLEAGADRSIADEDGKTALDHARADGQSAIVALLDG